MAARRDTSGDPRCRFCGKRLKPATTYERFTHPEPAAVEEACGRLAIDPALVTKVDWEDECERQMEPDHDGRLRPVILAGFYTGRRVVKAVRFRTGGFGCRGEGFFCNPMCGYFYALRVVKLQRS